MPCTELKQLEATCRQVERRRVTLARESERRKLPPSWLKARAAYIMRVHRLTCASCRLTRKLLSQGDTTLVL
jgi:hypothetical protein